MPTPARAMRAQATALALQATKVTPSIGASKRPTRTWMRGATRSATTTRTTRTTAACTLRVTTMATRRRGVASEARRLWPCRTRMVAMRRCPKRSSARPSSKDIGCPGRSCRSWPTAWASTSATCASSSRNSTTSIWTSRATWMPRNSKACSKNWARICRRTNSPLPSRIWTPTAAVRSSSSSSSSGSPRQTEGAAVAGGAPAH
mmetsp:Transcript_138386/g.441420  ORF Transcript_138386/g.441420 Transcript_138386/m.441420 type:complete len:204 (+) Transcript_138386:1941-2552(+)